jgi:hypothetical protein
MAPRLIQKTDGSWPRLRDLIDAEVVGVGWRSTGRVLVIELQPPASAVETLLISLPWVFASCLMSVASSEITTEEKDATETLPDLIGLDGARLTGIESDPDHLDLIFDSIRLSVSSNQ